MTRERAAGAPDELSSQRIPAQDGFVGPDLRFPLRDLLLLVVELFLG